MGWFHNTAACTVCIKLRGKRVYRCQILTDRMRYRAHTLRFSNTHSEDCCGKDSFTFTAFWRTLSVGPQLFQGISVSLFEWRVALSVTSLRGPPSWCRLRGARPTISSTFGNRAGVWTSLSSSRFWQRAPSFKQYHVPRFPLDLWVWPLRSGRHTFDFPCGRTARCTNHSFFYYDPARPASDSGRLKLISGVLEVSNSTLRTVSMQVLGQSAYKTKDR